MSKKLIIAASLALAFSFSTEGQVVPRIIMLETMSVPVVTAHAEATVAGLAELGYAAPDTLDLVRLNAGGDRSDAESLLSAAMEAGMPDVVITLATLATQAAVALLAETDVPIVFAVVSDPVGSGIVERIGRPTGTNITGTVYTIDRATKLDFATDILSTHRPPRTWRVTMVRSTYPSAEGDARGMRIAAVAYPTLHFRDHAVPYRTVPEGLPAMLSDVESAVSELSPATDLWWEPSGPLGELPEYSTVLRSTSDKPILYGNRIDSVRSGALFTVIPDWQAGGRQIAQIAARILDGEDPGSIPVARPDSFDVAVNLSTAAALELVIPPDILELAGPEVFR